jgi:site-specific DNA-methyltransferase (adenine-specific)
MKMETNIVYQEDCIEGMKKIPSNSIDLVLTDPPYGITACEWDKLIDLKKWWVEIKRVIKPNGAIVMTASQPFTTDLINSNREWFKYEIIWCKGKGSNFSLVKKQPLRIHEDILVFQEKMWYNPQMEKVEGKIRNQKKEVEEREWRGTNRPSDVNHFKKIKYSDDYNPEFTYPKSLIYFPNHLEKHHKSHPTQKPVELFKWLIKSYSNENQLVLDCFAGSGTTAIACIETNRKYICFENNPQYFKIINDRIKSAKSQTQLSNESCPNGEFNKDYQETSEEVSQIPNGTSDNPDIKCNKIKVLQ